LCSVPEFLNRLDRPNDHQFRVTSTTTETSQGIIDFELLKKSASDWLDGKCTSKLTDDAKRITLVKNRAGNPFEFTCPGPLRARSNKRMKNRWRGLLAWHVEARTDRRSSVTVTMMADHSLKLDGNGHAVYRTRTKPSSASPDHF